MSACGHKLPRKSRGSAQQSCAGNEGFQARFRAQTLRWIFARFCGASGQVFPQGKRSCQSQNRAACARCNGHSKRSSSCNASSAATSSAWRTVFSSSPRRAESRRSRSFCAFVRVIASYSTAGPRFLFAAFLKGSFGPKGGGAGEEKESPRLRQGRASKLRGLSEWNFCHPRQSLGALCCRPRQSTVIPSTAIPILRAFTGL